MNFVSGSIGGEPSSCVSCWDNSKVVLWVRSCGFPEEGCVELINRQTTGNNLLAARKENLPHEFAVLSSTLREQLWVLIEVLQRRAERDDHLAALKLQEELIKEETASNPEGIDATAVNILNFELSSYKAELKYRERAHEYDEREKVAASNFEAALKLQDEFESLRIIEAYDHQVAAALHAGRLIPQKSQDVKNAMSNLRATNPKTNVSGGGGGAAADDDDDDDDDDDTRFRGMAGSRVPVTRQNDGSSGGVGFSSLSSAATSSAVNTARSGSSLLFFRNSSEKVSRRPGAPI
jgi:hypothetical protein